MRKDSGVTLIEMLVAMAILAAVLALISTGVVNAMRGQRENDAANASQSKARRIIEVISQDIRGAVLGGIMDFPYATNNTGVSFALLDGGVGMPVVSQGATTTVIRSSADAAADLGLLNAQAMAVRSDGYTGESRLLDISAVQKNGSQFTLTHNNCNDPLGNNGRDLLLFDVESIGYRFDQDTNTIRYRQGNNAERTVAFDIEAFEVRYVYTDRNNGAVVVRATPNRDAANAPLSADLNTSEYLTRLQIDIQVATPSGSGRSSRRAYTSYIDLSSNQSAQGNKSFTSERILRCN